MNYREVFTKKHVFLAVIHVVSTAQALQNANIALDEGADGIFLISHGVISDVNLISSTYRYVLATLRRRSLNPFVGLNCLSIMPQDIFKFIPDYLSGIWIDNLGIKHDREYQHQPNCIMEARRKRGWDGLFFGGVAFKHQKAVSYENLPEISRAAMKFCDVITTSGEATGKAPEVKKIRLIRKAVGDFPIAIASGITPENVQEFMPYANCFLVATGISKSFTELNPTRVRRLSQAIR